MRNKKSWKNRLFALVLCALALLFAGCGQARGPAGRPGLDPQPFTPPQGALLPKTGLQSLLCIGIGYDGQGRSLVSSLQLLVLDERAEKLAIYSVPIETKAVFWRYEGETLREVREEVRLAYSAADAAGRGEGNVLEAVSQILLGAPIDHYIVMNAVQLEGINEILGDVPLDVDADFAAAYGLGEGLQPLGQRLAEYASFTPRDADGSPYPGTDERRLGRHRGMALRFLQALASSGRGEEGAGEILHAARTSMRAEELLAFARGALAASGVSEPETGRIPGEDRRSGPESEYLPDDVALRDLVLSLFFEEPAQGSAEYSDEK
ncbi:MAG: hypothetical protein LBD02_02570 [Christensenellaceae bacterium]|jgi:hypothetical protein|nr:hypothetical protein [Christensenellaceae bacterium]